MVGMRGRAPGRGSVGAWVCAFVAIAVPALAPSAAAKLQGELDRSFGNGGRAFLRLGGSVAPSSYNAIARQPDGSILLAGAVEASNGKYVEGIGFVQRRTASGAVDPSFGGGGVLLPAASDLALEADGRVLVAVPEGGGWCAARSTVRRLQPSGAVDPSFGEGGVSATLPLHDASVAVDAEGRILVAGETSIGPCGKSGIPAFHAVLARLLPDGRLDPGFGEGGVATGPRLAEFRTDVVDGPVIRDDGSIVIATSQTLQAYTPTGAPDPGFGDAGIVDLKGDVEALSASTAASWRSPARPRKAAATPVPAISSSVDIAPTARSIPASAAVASASPSAGSTIRPPSPPVRTAASCSAAKPWLAPSALAGIAISHRSLSASPPTGSPTPPSVRAAEWSPGWGS
jgi:uncharacterized delta-60 repeat protein